MEGFDRVYKKYQESHKKLMRVYDIYFLLAGLALAVFVGGLLFDVLIYPSIVG